MSCKCLRTCLFARRALVKLTRCFGNSLKNLAGPWSRFILRRIKIRDSPQRRSWLQGERYGHEEAQEAVEEEQEPRQAQVTGDDKSLEAYGPAARRSRQRTGRPSRHRRALMILRFTAPADSRLQILYQKTKALCGTEGLRIVALRKRAFSESENRLVIAAVALRAPSARACPARGVPVEPAGRRGSGRPDRRAE